MPDDAVPMTDRDIEPAPAGDALHRAEPLKPAGGAPAPLPDPAAVPANGDNGVRERTGKLGQQASDQVRRLADDGKAKAVGALGQVAQMLTDAAGTVDDKLGSGYGDYARQAAGSISGFAQRVDARDVDDIVEDARTFVRASPGVAIGMAAALGFVIARAVQSGIDADR